MYASRSTVIGPVFAQMESIRAAVARRNGALGVSTALLHQSGWFTQWLEGPGDAVQAVLERVARDPRHGVMHTLLDVQGPRTLHEPWSMAVVHADEHPEHFAQRVSALAQDHQHGVSHVPAAAWRLLSTPLGHVGARSQEDADLFCRTLVCAADVDESFDLVRWLGEHHRVEVVRRRFAGTDTPDVETDYVDFRDGARVHRVIAMARNGIRIGLTRAFLSDYGCIVLMRGTDPRRDVALLDLLASACAPLESKPTLVGVGNDPLQQGLLRQRAREHGLRYVSVDVRDRRDPAQVWEVLAPVARSFSAPGTAMLPAISAASAKCRCR